MSVFLGILVFLTFCAIYLCIGFLLAGLFVKLSQEPTTSDSWFFITVGWPIAILALLFAARVVLLHKIGFWKLFKRYQDWAETPITKKNKPEISA